MDFQMPDDVVEFREQIHDFIRRHRTPELEAEIAGHHLHGYGPAAETFLQALADEGLPSVAWPEEYGGRGKGALYLWILSEELAREGMPWDTLTYNSVSPTIMRHGSEEQRRDILPKVLSGEIRFALGYTEPNAGTDLASLQTRAVRDGDEWVINGQKIYTSSAHLATHVWLAARTDPDAPKHRGISTFVVPLSTPGITVRPLWVMGEGRTNETFYENVRIPADALVGEENRGWYIVTGALDLERVAIGTYRPLERRVQNVIAYLVNERSDLLDDPATRMAVADASMRVEVGRALATNNAAMVHNDLVPTMGSGDVQDLEGRLQRAHPRRLHRHPRPQRRAARVERGRPARRDARGGVAQRPARPLRGRHQRHPAPRDRHARPAAAAIGGARWTSDRASCRTSSAPAPRTSSSARSASSGSARSRRRTGPTSSCTAR